MNNNNKISKGFVFTFAACICWAATILITKFAIRGGEGSYNIVFWPTLFSLPFWLAFFIRQREEVKKIEAKDYWLLLWIGLIGTLFVSVVEVFALKYSQAINYSFLINSF